MYAMKSYCSALAAVLLLAAAPASARAELVYAESVTLNAGSSPDNPISNASDGDNGNLWYTADFVPDYFAAGPAPVLTFDLGGDKVLDGIAFWNYPNLNGNGARTFTLEFATEATPSDFSSSQEFTVDNAGWDVRQDKAFSESLTARYVRMTLTDNYYGEPGCSGGDRVGFAEIQFSSIPEPGTLALLATGLLGLLAYAWRRRR